MTQNIFVNAVLMPILEPLLYTLVTIVVGLLVLAVKRVATFFKVKIDEKQLDLFQHNLHSAAMTGMRLAIVKYGPSADTRTLVQEAMDYAIKTGAPSTIKKAIENGEMEMDGLIDLVTSKLELAKAEVVTPEIKLERPLR